MARLLSRKNGLSLGALATAGLLTVAGCGGPQVRNANGDQPTAVADGSLTIVGWSLRDQAPLGVVGVVRAESGRELGTFDTRVDPSRGRTFDHLEAGHYKIEIQQRLADGQTVAAAATDELDIPPNQRVRREVVVDDRDAVAAAAKSGGAEH